MRSKPDRRCGTANSGINGADMQANGNDRNAALLAAVLSGRTWHDVGCSVGISSERVRQVCRSLLRRLRQSAQHDEIPPHNPFVVSELRAHKDFWLRRLEGLRDAQPLVHAR